MRKRILLIFSFGVFVFSPGISQTSDRVHISGQVSQLLHAEVVLEKYVSVSPTEVARVKLNDKGLFRIDLSPEEIGFYRINFETPEYNSMGSQYINLVLDTVGEIHISADAPEIENSYQVTGSEDSKILEEINKELKRSFQRMDSLTKVYEATRIKRGVAQDSLARAFQGPYELVVNERENFIRDIILDNTSSISILTIIHYLDRDKDLDAFQLVDKALYKKYPLHPYVQNFHRKVLEYGRLSPGAPAPDIVLNDLKGKQIGLSAMKGKIVLLHFAASWSWPSRQENPELQRYYKMYRKEGLEIFSVCNEKDKESWKKMVTEDKMIWSVGSDLMSWDSPVFKSYDQRSVPYYYVIDRDGTILSKGVRNQELAAKLEELFKRKNK